MVIKYLDYMKKNEKVKSMKDLKSYIKTADLWGLDLKNNMPDHVLRFIDDNLNDSLGFFYTHTNLGLVSILLEDVISLQYTIKFRRPLDVECYFNDKLIWSFEHYLSLSSFKIFLKSIEISEEYEQKYKYEDKYLKNGYKDNQLFFEIENSENSKKYDFKMPMTKFNKYKILNEITRFKRENDKYYRRKPFLQSKRQNEFDPDSESDSDSD